MTRIIDICNNLIYKAKENEDIQNIKFFKAYREDFAQTPIEGFMGFIKIEKVGFSQTFVGGFADSSSKGQMVDVTLAIALYSDNSISGEALSVASTQVHQAMIKADDKGIIKNSSISPVEFDTNIKSIYREIRFNLAFCLCGEE